MAVSALFCALAIGQAGQPLKVAYKSIDETKKLWSIHVKYPVYLPKGPIANLASLAARQEAQRMVRQFREATEGIGKDWTPPAPLELEVKPVLGTTRSDLASLRLEWYSNTGGAHPNHGTTPLTFAVVRGKARQIRLADVLKPGIKPEEFVRKVVRPQLEREKKARGGDPEFEIAEQSYDRFVLTPQTITFFFDPYEIGPYVEGDYEVKLNLNAIRPWLDPKGPVRPVLLEK